MRHLPRRELSVTRVPIVFSTCLPARLPACPPARLPACPPARRYRYTLDVDKAMVQDAECLILQVS